MPIKYSWFTRDCLNRIEYYAAGSNYRAYSDSKNWTYYQRDDRRREPIFFGVAFCVADKVYNPFNGAILPWSKQELIYLIASVDLAVLIATTFVINFFEIRFREYAKVFDKANVEMRDFSVRLYNLPFDHQYGGKDLMLQAYLWEHVETHVRNAFEEKLVANNNIEKLEELAL